MRQDALLEEIGSRLLNAMKSSAGRRRRHVTTAAVLGACALVTLLVAVVAASNGFLSPHNHSLRESAGNVQVGLGQGPDVGPNWDPNYPQGREVTLQQAESEAGYPLYLPATPTVGNASITHVWVGSEEVPGPPMLPATPPTTVAVSYSAGVVVAFVPWVYGVNAPPFSQAQALSHYQQMAAEDAANQGGSMQMSTDVLSGIPVLIIPQDIKNSAMPSGENNPGSIEFQLGTSNSNAVTVMVQGRLTTSDLESVASSIISQWEQANPTAV